MSFGSIYEVSEFGDVNATNGWGNIYPFDADGSYLRCDTTKETVDDTSITADKTEY
tara:strand:+ start:3158 stop:3325 length:168 start_codon:yes stop_codon:yes gene_type:complete